MDDLNKKIFIKRSVIKELLSELVSTYGMPPIDLRQAGPVPTGKPRDAGPTPVEPPTTHELPYQDSPIVPDAEITQDLPLPVDDENFMPSNNEELAKSLAALSKLVPAEKIEVFYDKIKKYIGVKNVSGISDITTLESKYKMNKNNISLREHIQNILQEMYDDEYEDLDDYKDPDAVADEQEQWEQEEKDRQAAKAATEKEKLKAMAVELGAAGPSGVRRLQGVAMKRLTFIANMPQDVKQEMHKHATDDYIKMLNKSGELSGTEVDLMQDNPKIVQGLDGYREFLHKYIRREAKNIGVDLAIHSGEPLDMSSMADLAQKTRAAYGKSE